MFKKIGKRWLDILVGLILLLVLIPTTRKPIQIFLHKLIATAPSINNDQKKNILKDYKLSFTDGNGKLHELSNNRGEVIVINFWATWCPPCIAEMPMFQNLYNDYGKQVSFYFISQEDWETVNQFKRRRDLNLPFYHLENSTENLKYSALPTTYIIDKNGKILINKVGIADWNSKKVRQVLDAALKNE